VQLINARRWLTWTGGLLSAAGVLFLLQRAFTYVDQIDIATFNAFGYGAVTLLAASYGVSNCLLAAGWWNLLRRLKVPAGFPWAVRAYALSQMAKYVPGNVFQFVGRQVLGSSAGFENGPLLKSTFLELMLLAGAGGLFVPLIVPLAGSAWKAVGIPVFAVPWWLGCVGFVIAAALGLWALKRFGGSLIFLAGACYLTFVALSGVIFAGCYALAGGSIEISGIPPLIGAYVVAWLVGFLTPGAPAGLGMREAVLLLLLSRGEDEPTILLAVVLGRMVTVLGDLGFYLAGLAIKGRPVPPPLDS
jgi:glycosyltransferase 2 family protein